MNRRNAVTTAAAVKLAVFTVVSILVTGMLAMLMGNVGLGGGATYEAVFTNASMLQKGDDVRVAGVNVGEVRKIEHYDRSMAKVTFRVADDVRLTSASTAEIRFLNLVGDRYLALERGAGADRAAPLADGGTIPVSQTKPALDLTVLFDGFKPLFQALTPDQVNELSMNIVQVLQGEGGTIRGLLAHTSSLTNTLADRDALIGQVVTNLSETLDTVNSRRQQLSTLVIELRNWMQDLARDRDTIGSSLDNISDLTVVVADLLRQGRPLVKQDVVAIDRLARLLNKPDQRASIVDLLDRMPEMMRDQTRTGTYGSWYQYYVCGISVAIKLPYIGDIPIVKQLQDKIAGYELASTAPRCQDR
ncbi:MCE family protein [Nocardioides sp. YIM 152588]|uniref:MCE family protein n=1 Tax=Nocardioides sp. YIM 152588 TaxID=3158259 RepID=UPI0032E3D75C